MKTISVGECRNLEEVRQKIAEKNYQPISKNSLQEFLRQFVPEPNGEYGLIGFIGDSDADRSFPYIVKKDGKVGNSHVNWSKGTFLGFWEWVVK